MSAIIIETNAGKLRGVLQGGVVMFRGVPYGANTTGPQRFLPPAPPQPWTGVRDALEYGDSCVQIPTRRSPLFRWTSGVAPESEDCLNLNVYAPAERDGLVPVMVYLHGGAFSYGSSSAPALDGRALAQQQNVVVVTVNHRLGVLAHLASIDRRDPRFLDSSNCGMLDLVAALEWVRDHIERFGGDPQNVTIFGQSGGGTKVGLLMRMPKARGLFHRAIVQSTASGAYAQTMDEAMKASRHVLDHLGVDAAAFDTLRQLPAAQLIRAAVRVTQANEGHDYFRPVNDERNLFSEPYTPEADLQDMPVLIGYTDTEATFYLANNPAIWTIDVAEAQQRLQRFTRWPADQVAASMRAYHERRPALEPGDLLGRIAGDHTFKLPTIVFGEALAARRRSPVYMYKFGLTSSAAHPRLGAPHTIELPFIFGTLDTAPEMIADQPANRRVSNEMMQAWANFARHGHPSIQGVDPWPAFDADRRLTMVFDQDTRVSSDPDGADRSDLAPYRAYVAGEAMNYWQP